MKDGRQVDKRTRAEDKKSIGAERTAKRKQTSLEHKSILVRMRRKTE